ncbi:serine hydrolase domain-containing protein [Thermodesulfatator atlanticus]
MKHRPLPEEVRDMMRRGVKEKVFPGACLAIWHRGKSYLEAFGWQEFYPAPQKNSPYVFYDLASLTKPLATTLCLMRLLSEGKISLDDELGRFFNAPFWFEKATIADLLAHQAGFPDHRPYFVRLLTYPLEKRKEIICTWILKEPLAYPLGRKQVYSDLGFIILGHLIEKIAQKELDCFFRETISLLGLNPLKILFSPVRAGIPKEKCAATEFCPWRGKLIKGEVHDENAWALGGVAGHAGLFGSAEEVLKLLVILLKAYEGEAKAFLNRDLVQTFWDWQSKAGGRALGFDRPSKESSSAGGLISRASLGHLGFTGTSFWIDTQKELVILLLSNRVHPSRENKRIKGFRPALHDLIVKKICKFSV